MPCGYAIYKEQKLVITKVWDCVTFPEIRQHQEHFVSDPDFDAAFNLLIDATGITAFDITTDEAKTIASQGLFSSTSRRAFVAASPAIFGMGRLLGAYHAMATKRDNVRVFYDRALALKWLGLEDDPESKR